MTQTTDDRAALNGLADQIQKDMPAMLRSLSAYATARGRFHGSLRDTDGADVRVRRACASLTAAAKDASLTLKVNT